MSQSAGFCLGVLLLGFYVCVVLSKSCSGQGGKESCPDSTIPGKTADTLHSPPSKTMGQPCLVSEAADIPALKVEMLLSLSPIMEWPV